MQQKNLEIVAEEMLQEREMDRDRDRDSCKGKGKGKGKKKVNKSFSDSFPHLGRVRLEPFNPIDRTFRSCRVKLVGFFTNMIKCVSHGRFEC